MSAPALRWGRCVARENLLTHVQSAPSPERATRTRSLISRGRPLEALQRLGQGSGSLFPFFCVSFARFSGFGGCDKKFASRFSAGPLCFREITLVQISKDSAPLAPESPMRMLFRSFPVSCVRTLSQGVPDRYVPNSLGHLVNADCLSLSVLEVG